MTNKKTLVTCYIDRVLLRYVRYAHVPPPNHRGHVLSHKAQIDTTQKPNLSHIHTARKRQNYGPINTEDRSRVGSCHVTSSHVTAKKLTAVPTIIGRILTRMPQHCHDDPFCDA
jgi:hypothetical protein